MTRSTERFSQLLTEGVHRVRLRESKSIQVVQDELGYALGRKGGSVIEHWRKGYLPPYLSDVEKLARALVARGGLERSWLEKFLQSADYPYPDQLGDELFPPLPSNSGQTGQPNTGGPGSQSVPSLLKREFDPFIVGPPIVHSHHFFGREYELKRIFDLWKRFPMQNVAVTGLKRSGKTSLLHYLKNITMAAPEELRPAQRTDWLPQPEQYRWIFVDFQDARMCRRDRLLRYLLESLEMPVPNPCNLENFLDVFSLHLQRPVIILMDEINVALTAPELDQQFWESLRSLGSNLTGGNLAFLLTSPEPAAQLADEWGKSSPFFNIFGHTFSLGPLTEPEAHELIASSPRPFDPAEVDWITAQSGRWPYLLQILCHIRLAALEYGESGDGWQQEGLRRMAPYGYLLG